MPLGIVDLRERRQHADAVAERIWKAFWKHHGVPFALVAECDGEVCDNLLVVDNDEPARPNLSPGSQPRGSMKRRAAVASPAP